MAETKSRSDIVADVAAAQELPQSKVDAVVRAYEEQIVQTLAKKGEVRLAGFGTYKTSKRSARTARNPQTGEPIKIKASTAARFKPGKAVKDAVNGVKADKKPAKKVAAKKPAKKKAAKKKK